MFGVGMPELLVIFVVALIVLGPNRLPEIARMLGKAMGEFRKATSGLTDELENARVMLEEEARKASELPKPKIAPASGTEPKSAPGSHSPPEGTPPVA